MKPVFRPDMKKVIFFDLNDTLIDPQKAFDRAFLHTLEDWFGRWQGNAVMNPKHILKSYKNNMKLHQNQKKSRKQEWQISSLQEALRAYPFSAELPMIKQFFQQVDRLMISKTTLLPQVNETIRSLNKHYSLGIITNGMETKMEEQINQLPIRAYFQYIFSSRKMGSVKPNPKIFQKALTLAQATPDQAVMVGNSWKHDIYGATRSGMDAVWLKRVNRRNFSQRIIGKEKVLIIRKFNQLTELFEC